MGERITHEQAEAIRCLLDDVGRAEGAQGIESIVDSGYHGDLPVALVAAFDGDATHARGHVRAAAYEIYRSDDFERS